MWRYLTDLCDHAGLLMLQRKFFLFLPHSLFLFSSSPTSPLPLLVTDVVGDVSLIGLAPVQSAGMRREKKKQKKNQKGKERFRWKKKGLRTLHFCISHVSRTQKPIGSDSPNNKQIIIDV
jgi:hypothetical protein